MNQRYLHAYAPDIVFRAALIDFITSLIADQFAVEDLRVLNWNVAQEVDKFLIAHNMRVNER